MEGATKVSTTPVSLPEVPRWLMFKVGIHPVLLLFWPRVTSPVYPVPCHSWEVITGCRSSRTECATLQLQLYNNKDLLLVELQVKELQVQTRGIYSQLAMQVPYFILFKWTVRPHTLLFTKYFHQNHTLIAFSAYLRTVIPHFLANVLKKNWWRLQQSSATQADCCGSSGWTVTAPTISARSVLAVSQFSLKRSKVNQQLAPAKTKLV